MRAFFATVWKELLLLVRDRAGLLVLFAMPTVLVLVVSLVQNNILAAAGESGFKVLFVDGDGDELGRRIAEELTAGGMDLVRESGQADPEAARREVAAGRFQFAVVVSPGATAALRGQARQLAEAALEKEGKKPAGPPAALEIFYDPTVQGSARTAVTSSVRLVALGLETEEKLKMLAEALPARLEREVKDRFSYVPADFAGNLPSLRAGWDREGLLPVRAAAATAAGDLPRLPTAVQQNVPAWALFGMFFIVVPLAGTLLRERQEGTLQRLRTIPISPLALLGGKIAAYLLVCLAQFGLMLLVGKLVLPLFGTPVLEIGEASGAIFLLALCAGLAATGFGLLVGTLAGSYEQASMLGAISVVIAAALGGVMVPVYVMPEPMQAISAISPLAWGLNGFLDLFVRGGNLSDIVPNALSLLGFFAATLAAAWAAFNRRSRTGN